MEQQDLFNLKQNIFNSFTRDEICKKFTEIDKMYFDTIIENADLEHLKEESPELLLFSFMDAIVVYKYDYNENSLSIAYCQHLINKHNYKPGHSFNYSSYDLEPEAMDIYNEIIKRHDEVLYLSLEKVL